MDSIWAVANLKRMLRNTNIERIKVEASYMNKINVSFVRLALKDESGQVLLPWVAVVMTSFLGISGLVTDVGRAYVAHSQLQNVANAAALAAAGEVYNTSSTADAYATA